MYTKENKLRIAILISGRGSNMEAIVRRRVMLPNVEVVCVISDQEDAHGLTIARNFNLEAVYLPAGPFKTKLEGEAEQNYIAFLKERNIDLICLAGFMRIVKSGLLSAFPGRIINIHPSILPLYPGLHTHERALANNDKEAGCTIHFVDSGTDTGAILRQRRVPILERDNPDKLANRVLKQEHIIYTEVLKDISENIISIGK